MTYFFHESRTPDLISKVDKNIDSYKDMMNKIIAIEEEDVFILENIKSLKEIEVNLFKDKVNIERFKKNLDVFKVKLIDKKNQPNSEDIECFERKIQYDEKQSTDIANNLSRILSEVQFSLKRLELQTHLLNAKNDISDYKYQVYEVKGSFKDKITKLSCIEDKILKIQSFVNSLDEHLKELRSQRDQQALNLQDTEKTYKPLVKEGILYSSHYWSLVRPIEYKIKNFTKQIKDIEEIIEVVPKALNYVQKSLSELKNMEVAKVVITKPYLEFQIPKKNLIVLSEKFRQSFTFQTNEGYTIDLEERSFDPENLLTFFQFLESGEVEDIKLSGENVEDLLLLADEHRVELLLNACTQFIIEHASMESIPDLIEKSLARNQKWLLWIALQAGMRDPKALGETEALNEKNLEKYPENVRGIINELKGLALLAPSLELKKGMGEMVFSKLPQEFPTLDYFSKLFPLSFEVPKLSEEEFEALPSKCPFLKHLIIMDSPFNSEKTIEILKKFDGLNSFGNLGYLFSSMEDFNGFSEKLSPITLSVLNLNEMGNITDDELKLISRNLKNLKKLSIASINITDIPFKHLEELNCRNCTSLVNFEDASIDVFTCINGGLKRCLVPSATKFNISDCPFLEIVDARSSKEDADFSKSLHLKALDVRSAPTVNVSNSPLLETIDVRSATNIKISDCPLIEMVNAPLATRVGACSFNGTMDLIVPENCSISTYSSTSYRKHSKAFI